MRSEHRYIIVGQTPVPEPDLLKWGRWMETAERTVARDEVGATVVSTVFPGLDHRFSGDGAPLLFETMLFTDGDGGGECVRTSTWAEAEEMHRSMLRTLREPK